MEGLREISRVPHPACPVLIPGGKCPAIRAPSRCE
jgi:hypothetical protein